MHARPEADGDRRFSRDLFIACSPLNGTLPPAMLGQQADLQHAAHGGAYPSAMRRIVLRANTPVARVVIDWSATGAARGVSRCVDIAVAPSGQGEGVGTAILRAWLDTADRMQGDAALSVLRTNPALRLYARLGFQPIGDLGERVEIELRRVFSLARAG